MSISEGILIAPLDPDFNPSYSMFKAVCDLLVSSGLSAKHPVTKNSLNLDYLDRFLEIQDIKLLANRLLKLSPNQWNQANLELFDRSLEFDPYDSVYLDEDHLRNAIVPLPTTGVDSRDLHIEFDELYKLRKYFDGKHQLTLNVPMSQMLENNLYHLGYYDRIGRIYMRCGFHYEKNHSVGQGEEEAYFKLFPYAPKALREDDHPDKKDSHLLLSYAGCFSLTIYTMSPWFASESVYWPDMTAEENLERFKAQSVFYQVLKPGLERIFNQAVDVFVCVDL